METQKRIITIDVLRGLTIAMMILVNNPGSWGYIHAPFRHAAWHGCTPTDLVFPFFLYIVGAAMWFSFKKYGREINSKVVKKILKRTILIFIIGYFVNNFYSITDIANHRILGVLQRIALAYGVAALLCLKFDKKQLIIISGAILSAYWFILWFFGDADPYAIETNIVRKIDLAILGENHVWPGYKVPFEPEGFLSTLPSIVTVILGYIFASLLSTMKRIKAVKQYLQWGILLVVSGYLWGIVFPVNKALWTSTFVLVTAGWATLFMGAFVWIIDIKNIRNWINPFIVFGMNPLFIYVLSSVVATIIAIFIKWENTQGKIISLKSWIYNEVFLAFGQYNGSLMYALAFVSVFWMIAYFMYKRKIFIKI